MSLKAVHYINQFYAGIGGETMADTGFGILEEKKGPALGLEPHLMPAATALPAPRYAITFAASLEYPALLVCGMRTLP